MTGNHFKIQDGFQKACVFCSLMLLRRFFSFTNSEQTLRINVINFQTDLCFDGFWFCDPPTITSRHQHRHYRLLEINNSLQENICTKPKTHTDAHTRLHLASIFPCRVAAASVSRITAAKDTSSLRWETISSKCTVMFEINKLHYA